MNRVLRGAFFLIVVRPILTVMLGANVRRRELLPAKGPAIVVANHNSHLDTLIIMALFPMSLLPRLRPVAAMDYFMRNRVLAWFAPNIIGIIPLARAGHAHGHPLAGCEEALDRGDILILFPEGSRGEPEELAAFKRGVAHLARARPQTPVHPLFMHGLGKALPKDSFLLVPFNCDVIAGERFFWPTNSTAGIDEFMTTLQTRIAELAVQIHVAPWD